jgi:DNA repair protein RadA/Sms
MATVKTVYYCQNCGAQSAKWIGRCPSCGQWNTYVEEVVKKQKQTGTKVSAEAAKPIAIGDINAVDKKNFVTGDNELNRVLGGGIVNGSLVLIGGEPGIGKSTLMLQLSLKEKKLRVLYVSGEESEQQIRLRAERFGIENDNCYILTETSTDMILHHIEVLDPELIIIDSVQTMQSPNIDSSAGSISQIRECASEFQRYAKTSGVPVFLIGHITKDGMLAGPKVLEHMVDTVLQFEGDQHYSYRILRTLKNRFGSTSEIGIYEMLGNGLRPVNNPSEILITPRDEPLSGIAIGCTLEGMRPILIETQALVTQAVYGTPQRTATGFDTKRLNMLLAVLEKRCGFHFGVKDVFLNIAGGIRIEDPAMDLAVVSALVSSFEDTAINAKLCFSGEVGLAGEIRPVNRLEQRVSEADKLGFERIFISKYNKKGIDFQRFNIQVSPLSKVEELIRVIF